MLCPKAVQDRLPCGPNYQPTHHTIFGPPFWSRDGGISKDLPWHTLGNLGNTLCNVVNVIKHLLGNLFWFLTLGISHTFAGDSKLVMKSYL